MTIRPFLTAVAVSALLPMVASAQQVPGRDAVVTPTFGTASISGVVINDASPAQPVRRAIVTLSGSGLVPSRSAISDDEGRFEIGGLPAGRFQLGVSRSGFITSSFGAKRPGRPGTAITIEDKQRLADVRLKIWRGAVIAGTLRNEAGEPMPAMPVFVVPARTIAGASLTLGNNGVTTNDLGEFRIFGLEPGTYAVVARPAATGGGPMSALSDEQVDATFARLKSRSATRSPSSSAASDATPPLPPTFAYAPIFYPGTADVTQAEPIRLVAGQVVEGLSFAIQRVATAAVEGLVTRPDGQSANGASVQLLLVEPPGPFPSDEPVLFDTRAGTDGRFTIHSVTPGQYRVVARADAAPPAPRQDTGGMMIVSAAPTGAQLWASSQITMVGSDVSGLVLALEPGRTLKGQFRFAGNTPPPKPLQVRVGFMPVQGISRSGTIRTIAFVSPVAVTPDGTFELPGVPPGRFRFSVFGPALTNSRWVPHSAVLGTVDLFDGIVDTATLPPGDVTVTYADTSAELSGVLQTADGSPFSDVFVIAFSTSPSHWGAEARRVKAVRPGVDGRYVIAGLPPGDYHLSAITDVDQDEWQEPSFLAELVASSLTLKVAEGEKKVQHLQITG